jgi:maltooligosyltrehalose trehalohydrolase
VIYEMHIGTFTPEGTWASAARKLPHLKDVGVTLIEMMPVNEFPGGFGWGYDGVNLFAPTRLYGNPDDLRAFIDAAHGLGIGVILDVVYNHFGPDGNYLAAFASDYFTDRYDNEWGDAINFDGPNAAPVREFFTVNAAYWIAEFHFDGLRLDATQCMFDNSPRHLVADISQAARTAAGARKIILIGESEPQDANLARPVAQGGGGLDALWNDDLHHSAMVALSGRNEAYYEDHEGAPQEFVSAVKYGFLFQGQRYAHQQKRRGRPSFDLAPRAFVNYIQNHDQIANSACGSRVQMLAAGASARAMTALILLIPGMPMLFQGQEFWASTPFLYFADQKPELVPIVHDGRRDFVAQFPSIGDSKMIACFPAPHDEATFKSCILDWREAERNTAVIALHRDLIALRQTDLVFKSCGKEKVDGAVLGPEAFVLRFFGDGEDRLLVINLGRDLNRASFPEPLMAPPTAAPWRLIWSSEDPDYGGCGTPPIESQDGWRLPGRAAIVLASMR